MKIEMSHVFSNKLIATKTYEMVLELASVPSIQAGQFINIKIDTLSLRRPISICRIENRQLTIIYKVVGKGTELLSKQQAGACLDIMMPLGSGFPIHQDIKSIVCIAGGIGLPPLYEVAKAYRASGTDVTVIAGFNANADVFYREEFEQLGCRVIIATLQDESDFLGNGIEAAKFFNLCDQLVYSCGPTGMLQAVEAMFKKGYVSFEAHMGCGFGVCNSCSCKDSQDSNLSYRICKEGPVFEIGKVRLTC